MQELVLPHMKSRTREMEARWIYQATTMCPAPRQMLSHPSQLIPQKREEALCEGTGTGERSDHSRGLEQERSGMRSRDRGAQFTADLACGAGKPTLTSHVLATALFRDCSIT